MSEDRSFTLDVTLEHDYRLRVDFGDLDGVPPLVVDEPPPLGGAEGPNPARVLGAAVASCMGASLLFCLRKARVDVRGLRARVEGEIVRNEQGRFRVGGLRVRLAPEVPDEQRPRMARCLEVFEDFCIIGQSVRAGIDVEVSVDPVAPGAPAFDDANPMLESEAERALAGTSPGD